MPAPDLTAVRTYLGDASSFTEAEITSALAAEKAAQSSVCKVPADAEVWPADLAEALKRRVARNLALKSLPLGLQTAISEAAVATVRVGADSEVRRLEAPYRRLVLA